MRRVALIGGGGLRTPLVVYGLAECEQRLGVENLVLYDIDTDRAAAMARLCREIVRRRGAGLRIDYSNHLEPALEGAEVILSSIRVGGMAARARDERIAIEHGLAGQETTGPGGAAMALRTLPITLAHARVAERVAPDAWFISFTNPAGLITQALAQNTRLRVIGICDTPIELFHRIAWSFGLPYADMTFDHVGLNHLGWVRAVKLLGEDITARILAEPDGLRRIYPAALFDPEFIQTLGLIPTEYLFFYYSQRRAYLNQVKAGASRGEELERMNTELFHGLRAQDASQALDSYRRYLLRRNSSYLRLEAGAESAFEIPPQEYDPFDTPTGYHRIALDVMQALDSDEAREIVVDYRNGTAVADLQPEDVVEVPCEISRNGVHPKPRGRLPEQVRGLVEAVKQYERTTIRSALEGSAALARLALTEYPIVGQWELAGDLIKALIASDPRHLGYLR
jgi:6-phospho-beta-glucosidase